MKKMLLTGPPRVGKTTIVKKLVSWLKDEGVSFKGFYTEEIRNKKGRIGFKLVTFNGMEKVLAHVSIKSSCRVGKYGVDISALEEVLELITPESRDEIIIIDEIGKMECFSEKFKTLVLNALKWENPFLGTIALKGDSFIEYIKKMQNIELIAVTTKNRNELFFYLKDKLSSVS
jgi:nucleoside-triphosphatase